MADFHLTITDQSVRRARALFRLLKYKNKKRRINKRQNRLRNKSMKDKRYWRASSKSGMVDLGYYTEPEAIEIVIKMGPIVFNDWENAIIIYDDGNLQAGDSP